MGWIIVTAFAALMFVCVVGYWVSLIREEHRRIQR